MSSINRKSLELRSVIAALACVLALVLPKGTVHAEPIKMESPEEMQRMADSLFEGRFPIDDKVKEITVPTPAQRDASPVDFGTFIMELVERGERATQRNDFEGAAKYFRALARAVPDKSLAYSLLCNAYESAGDSSNALDACANALSKTGVTVGDFQHYAKLVLAQPGQLVASRVKDLDAIAAHLAKVSPDALDAPLLRCEIGVRLLDDARLSECTAQLHALAPNNPKTIGYEWTLALRRGDYTQARSVVERAKQSTMPRDAVDVMARATERASSPWHQSVRFVRARSSTLLSATACLLLGIAMITVLRRRRALAHVSSEA